MFDELKKICYAENMKLHELGLVIYTFGNVSVADRGKGMMAIKPSGVDYDKVTPADMVVVSLETGKPVDGTLRPSSDTNTH